MGSLLDAAGRVRWQRVNRKSASELCEDVCDSLSGEKRPGPRLALGTWPQCRAHWGLFSRDGRSCWSASSCGAQLRALPREQAGTKFLMKRRRAGRQTWELCRLIPVCLQGPGFGLCFQQK